MNVAQLSGMGRTRAGSYERSLHTVAGEVNLKVPKLRRQTFETAIIERYRRRESSVEEALIEMYLAGISVRRVEDITEALWGTRVSPSTVSNLNKKIYAKIEAWRNRRIEGEHSISRTYLKPKLLHDRMCERFWTLPKAVAHLVDAHGMSERRACKAIGCCRMTMRYQTTRADDAGSRQRMKVIAQERRRFGYRRLHVLLKREGYVINHKRLFRLYRDEKLAARRRGGRKRAIGTRAPMLVPMAPNDPWSLDFVSDQLTDCRRFRILTIVDDCTRKSLALVADTSLSGVRVARELDRLMIERGKPKIIVSDNGSELTRNAILTWADQAPRRIGITSRQTS